MDNRLKPLEDRLETRRWLIKLLRYVEEECRRAGYSNAGRMAALSRSTLERGFGGEYFRRFDGFDDPQFH